MSLNNLTYFIFNMFQRDVLPESFEDLDRCEKLRESAIIHYARVLLMNPPDIKVDPIKTLQAITDEKSLFVKTFSDMTWCSGMKITGNFSELVNKVCWWSYKHWVYNDVPTVSCERYVVDPFQTICYYKIPDQITIPGQKSNYGACYNVNNNTLLSHGMAIMSKAGTACLSGITNITNTALKIAANSDKMVNANYNNPKAFEYDESKGWDYYECSYKNYQPENEESSEPTFTRNQMITAVVISVFAVTSLSILTWCIVGKKYKNLFSHFKINRNLTTQHDMQTKATSSPQIVELDEVETKLE